MQTADYATANRPDNNKHTPQENPPTELKKLLENEKVSFGTNPVFYCISRCLTVLVVFFIFFKLEILGSENSFSDFGSFIGGILGPILSFAALIAAIKSLKAAQKTLDETQKQLKASLYAQSQTRFVDLELCIKDRPQVLTLFHGIEEESLRELKESGIEPEHISYLLALLTAESIRHRSEEEAGYSTNKEPFRPGDYIYKVLESPGTRKAWPVVGEMMTKSAWHTRLNNTIKTIEEKSTK